MFTRFDDKRPQHWLNQNLYVILWIGALWLGAFLPTHLILSKFFASPKHDAAAKCSGQPCSSLAPSRCENRRLMETSQVGSPRGSEGAFLDCGYPLVLDQCTAPAPSGIETFRENADDFLEFSCVPGGGKGS